MEPKEKVRYDRVLLDSCLERDGATLVGEYEKVTSESKIKFICKCGEDGEKGFRALYKYAGLSCKLCSNKIRMEKTIETNITKYGSEHSFQNKEVKAKIKAKIKEKYGVEYIMQNKEIQEKGKQTNLQRYGVEHISQTRDFQTQVSNTNLKKRGVKCSLQSEEVKERIKETLNNRYGVTHNFMNGELRDKRKNTFLEKYGVEHPAQNPEIFDKQQKNAKKFKNYIMPSGDVRRVQGYEPFALDDLLKMYTEDQIITERSKIPRISYKTSEEKQKYYFPDIYIPHENKIIEVKSTWTYQCKTDGIKEKQKATQEAGYNYEIWCFNGKGERVDV